MRGCGLVTDRTSVSATGLNVEPSVFARLAIAVSLAPRARVEAPLDFSRQLAVMVGDLVERRRLEERRARTLRLRSRGRPVNGGGELQRFVPVEGELFLDIVAQGLGQVG